MRDSVIYMKKKHHIDLINIQSNFGSLKMFGGSLCIYQIFHFFIDVCVDQQPLTEQPLTKQSILINSTYERRGFAM